MKVNYSYEFERDGKRKFEIQSVIQLFLDSDYGETIMLSQLGKMLNLNLEDEKENKKFKSIMQRVKNILIDYGKLIKSITNVGYYIMKPKQVSGYCYHTYIRKTTNLLEKSDRILTHIDTSELSEIRKQERNDVMELNDRLDQDIEDDIVRSHYMHNKEKYDGLED